MIAYIINIKRTILGIGLETIFQEPKRKHLRQRGIGLETIFKEPKKKAPAAAGHRLNRQDPTQPPTSTKTAHKHR